MTCRSEQSASALLSIMSLQTSNGSCNLGLCDLAGGVHTCPHWSRHFLGLCKSVYSGDLFVISHIPISQRTLPQRKCRNNNAKPMIPHDRANTAVGTLWVLSASCQAPSTFALTGMARETLGVAGFRFRHRELCNLSCCTTTRELIVQFSSRHRWNDVQLRKTSEFIRYSL